MGALPAQMGADLGHRREGLDHKQTLNLLLQDMTTRFSQMAPRGRVCVGSVLRGAEGVHKRQGRVCLGDDRAGCVSGIG
eukprot:1838340-Rhodomonas_salina.2